jgi:membrane fusion protein, multidrug efflux system
LQQVLFKEGQLVSKGQLLATIDPRQFEMAVLQATGQRQRDEAQLENARLTLQRYQTLLQQDSIARQEVDTQAALVRQLEGTATSNRANEGTARLNLGYSRIVAPIAGRVGLRVVDIGNVVSAGDAGGIAVITQIAPIDVEFSLPQDRVPELQARMASGAVLTVTALDRTRTTMLGTGRFSTLDNQIDTQTGTVRAKARFANAKEALFPNQFVNVRLQLQTVQGAVVVPVAALRNSSKGEFVYVLDEAARTVATRPVQRGPATDEMVVIAQGLQAGEKVITEGADRLKDGARVTLAGDAPASGPGGGRRGAKAGVAGASGASGAGGARTGGRDAASGARRRASDAVAP